MKIEHSLAAFPNIFLKYDLKTQEVDIGKVIHDSVLKPGTVLNLNLTVAEIDAIMFDLKRFSNLIKCRNSRVSKVKEWLWKRKKQLSMLSKQR